MRVYRGVCTYIWNDDKFPYASDDCQLVWFHIFTNPLSTSLGIFQASMEGLAADKNRNQAWPLERYRAAFEENLELGFIKYDADAHLISFPKYFALENTCNHPKSMNAVKSWGYHFNRLPESPLKLEVYQSLKELLEMKHEGKADGIEDGMRHAFAHAFVKPKGMAKGMASGMAKAMANGMPRAIQDTRDKKQDTKYKKQETINKIHKSEDSDEKKIKSCGDLSGSPPPKSALTWEAYASVYNRRYGTEPVRNQTVNAMLCKVVDKLGIDEAPQVAAFYVTHNGAFYVQKMHPVNLLLQDAEKLRTEWATGKKMTRLEAQSAEQRDAVQEQIERVGKMLGQAEPPPGTDQAKGAGTG